MWKTASRPRWLMPALLALGLLGAASTAAAAPDFDPEKTGSDAAALVDELSDEGLPRDFLVKALAKANASEEVLDAMSGAVERHLEWPEYRAIFFTAERIEQGARFMERHREALERAQATYGVPPEVITAIIGVETYYGRHKGEHRVLDSLATLAFEHPERGDFFRGELAAFLRLAYEQDMDPQSLLGSYAGAMGYPQFIPTSYDAYAIDFDDDGQRDLWHNPADAIGSVANYFAEHGWRRGEAVYQPALGPEAPPEGLALNQTSRPETTLGEAVAAGVYPLGRTLESLADNAQAPVVPLRLAAEEGSATYRLGGYNFYVITRYNHSHLYAMAVAELARAIAADAQSSHQDEDPA
ncbi:lytic murein transglycosylase B [Halomonas garicola]|uniref:lytic murein transglycosylase B n=1 Tax=Halomonas garicola TaxID=1690008 RepID=UPI0028A0EDC8|nr:lytic murein transglycosylase B [Halomonas garicola]